jgi:hypothetical protein
MIFKNNQITKKFNRIFYETRATLYSNSAKEVAREE